MIAWPAASLMLAEGRPISGFSEGFRAIATERILYSLSGADHVGSMLSRTSC